MQAPELQWRTGERWGIGACSFGGTFSANSFAGHFCASLRPLTCLLGSFSTSCSSLTVSGAPLRPPQPRPWRPLSRSPRLSLMQHSTPTGWPVSSQHKLLFFVFWQALGGTVLAFGFFQVWPELQVFAPQTPGGTVRSSEWLIEDLLTWLSPFSPWRGEDLGTRHAPTVFCKEILYSLLPQLQFSVTLWWLFGQLMGQS